MRAQWSRNTPTENIPAAEPGMCATVVVTEWDRWNLRRVVRVAGRYAWCSRKATVGTLCAQHSAQESR